MKYFRFLVFGNAISAYGSYLNMLALNLFAYELTKSALFSDFFSRSGSPPDSSRDSWRDASCTTAGESSSWSPPR